MRPTLLNKIDEINQMTQGEIFYAIRRERFKFIECKGEKVGFFTWFEHDNGKCIFVNNMYIEPAFRSRNNLLWVRKVIRDFYLKKYEDVYWRNRRRNREFHCK